MKITRPSAKISSNVTFLCLSVQSEHHSDGICWRSVIHTCRSAKISSNVTFFYLGVQVVCCLVLKPARVHSTSVLIVAAP